MVDDQRQSVDDPPETEDHDDPHEDGEPQRQLCVFAERVHRLHDAAPRQERRDDRQEGGQDNERDVPNTQHAATFLHHHRVEEGRRGEPGQGACVLHRPVPIYAPTPLSAPRAVMSGLSCVRPTQFVFSRSSLALTAER